MSAKEEKKIRDKERKQLEEAARMKADALRDDDLAFDVAFEAPADSEAAAEARDIKVSAIPEPRATRLALPRTPACLPEPCRVLPRGCALHSHLYKGVMGV